MQKKLTTNCLAVLVFAAVLLGQRPSRVNSADGDVFRDSVGPIFVARCLACHGTKKQEGNFSMANMAAMFRQGDSGRAPVVPGKPADSELFQRLTNTDPDQRMPAEAEPLSAAEIDSVRRWINSLGPNPALNDRPIEEYASDAIGKVVPPVKYHKRYPITTLVLNPDQSRIYASGYGEITVWDTATGQLAQRIPIGWPYIADIEASSQGDWLAVSAGIPGQLGVVQLIDAHGTRPPKVLARASDIFPDAALSPDGSKLSIGASDGSLRIMNCQSGATLHHSTPHADTVNAIAWSPTGEYILTASRDRTAKLFRAEDYELVASFDRHERTVGGVALLKSFPVSVDETGKLRIWPDDGTDRELAEYAGLARIAQRIAADGSQLLIPDRNQIRRFQVSQREEDAGKDENDKPKKKTKTSVIDASGLELPSLTRIVSLSATQSGIVAAGTDRGVIHIWFADDEKPRRTFVANP